MKRIVLLFSLPVMVFLVLLLFSFSFQDRVQEKLKTLEKLDKDIIETDANLEIENLFANDLSLATEDFEDITRRVIAQKKFWNEFVNPDLNIVTNHGIKSSSGVNTEINKLLSFLNRTFDSRKVKLGFSNLSETNFFTPQNQQPKRYGFGFTAYDGFWPSFEKQEANDLLKQAKIIKEMCEFLLDSFDANENFNLITIKRETAGSEDNKHIGDNLYAKNSDTHLLRESGLVQSYVFEISFTGKTQNCRSFINQLRPPYTLRSLKAYRNVLLDVENRQDSFEEPSPSNETDILPIIRDITSTFTVVVEYVFAGPVDINNQIQNDLTKSFDEDEVSEILKEIQ